MAADLVRDFPKDRIRRQVEVLDWLREHRPKRIKDKGAYLAEAIRKDFAAPAGFQSRAERAEAESVPPEVALPPLAPPPSEQEVLEDQIRQWRTWESIPGHPLGGIARQNLAALEAEAVAGGRP